jgi:hypothetical protein
VAVDHEQIITALLRHLVCAVAREFTGTGADGSAVIAGVSSFDGLRVGCPIIGPGVQADTVIYEMDAESASLVLSQPLGEGAGEGCFNTGFLTTGRRVIPWDKVTEQPALFLRHVRDEDNFSGDNNLGAVTIELEAWIYSRAGQDPSVAPDISLNVLAEMIRDALEPDDLIANAFTLDGLVYRCRIEGDSEFDPGDLDAQGKALIPIKILIP